MALFKLKPVETIDFSTLERLPSPNSYLVCPPSFSAADADQEAPIFEPTVQTLLAAWDALTDTLPRTGKSSGLVTILSALTCREPLLLDFPISSPFALLSW